MQVFKLSKVAGLQSAILQKMNYFTGSFKFSERLHSYYCILYKMIQSILRLRLCGDTSTLIFCPLLFNFNFMAPFNGWGSTASRLQSHYEEAVYFLPQISLKFPVLVWSTSEDKRLSRSWSQTVVFKLGPLDDIYHICTIINIVFFYFSCELGILVRHQNRHRLHLKLEVYSEHSRTSKKELFTKIINRF